jgi:hypothetical protein
MTFDQSQYAFRGHKTYKAAAAYLDIAFHYKLDEAIGEETFLTPLAR